MKLSTKYKIHQHKKQCKYVFRLKARRLADTTQYICAFENKLIATEKRPVAPWAIDTGIRG